VNLAETHVVAPPARPGIRAIKIGMKGVPAHPHQLDVVARHRLSSAGAHPTPVRGHLTSVDEHLHLSSAGAHPTPVRGHLATEGVHLTSVDEHLHLSIAGAHPTPVRGHLATEGLTAVDEHQYLSVDAHQTPVAGHHHHPPGATAHLHVDEHHPQTDTTAAHLPAEVCHVGEMTGVTTTGHLHDTAAGGHLHLGPPVHVDVMIEADTRTVTHEAAAHRRQI
jgi:hypothetical protein